MISDRSAISLQVVESDQTHRSIADSFSSFFPPTAGEPILGELETDMLGVCGPVACAGAGEADFESFAFSACSFLNCSMKEPSFFMAVSGKEAIRYEGQ